MNHGWALLSASLGSVLLTLPGWINPLLSAKHAKELNDLLIISPHSYRELAIICFFSGVLYASFLAWDEQREISLKADAELADTRAAASNQHEQTLAMQAQTDAINRQTEELALTRQSEESRATQRRMRAMLDQIVGADSKELSRRQTILQRLHQLYCLNHNSVGPGILARTEPLPKEWVELELAKMGETWKQEKYY